MPEYFLILLSFLIITVFLHKKFKIKIYKSIKHLVITNLIFLVMGTVFDHFAIWRGHWSFGEKYLLGSKIGLMPIEEYGFILIMTYFIFVVYRILEKYIN